MGNYDDFLMLCRQLNIEDAQSIQKRKRTKFRRSNTVLPKRQTTRNLVLPAGAVTIQSFRGHCLLVECIVTNCSQFCKPDLHGKLSENVILFL